MGVLLSFTALEWGQAAVDRVAGLTDYVFIAVEPLCWPGSCIHTLPRTACAFSDLVASVDVVVTKPRGRNHFGVHRE